MAAHGWPRGSRRLQPPYRRILGSGKTVCGAAVVSSLDNPLTLLRGPARRGCQSLVKRRERLAVWQGCVHLVWR